MPLDFDATKQFRDFLISRTLQVPNGPQSFTSQNYRIQNLSDSSNVDPGAVDTNRRTDLSVPQSSNLFKPVEYFVKDTLETLPRRANLSLYYNGTPYFVSGEYNLVSIMSNSNYDNESELFKFAASYIRDRNQKGPVYSRIEQNLLKSTLGRIRLLDALEGNLATATNIVTGREPLVENNNMVTVAKTLPGKTIDFIQTVGGVEFPFTEIPGDYLSNPFRQTERRKVSNNEVGRTLQDSSGAILSLLGIKNKPLETRKPSDLLIDYTGSGPKQRLFDLLSLSKYAPNYTTTARSQNTSKIFSFVDKLAQSAKNLLGVEAPAGVAYIGDDRGDDVKNTMSDLNGNVVFSNYYLSRKFDEVQSTLFERQKNKSEGGQLSGKLTWLSINSNFKVDENIDTADQNINTEKSKLQESLSTNYKFREDSILGKTQFLLDSLPKGGEGKSHVANVIDQTSKVFKEGEKYLSKGSSIKFVNKFGQESGVEYCRTWTKDRPYLTYSDTMKKGGNIRKYEGTIVSNPWNLNIGPISNGKKSFDGSTNIFENGKKDKDGNSFYAKKYMFSIENLAWKTSSRPGFTVLDLPVCERGPNGGRVMWFPPYDLKVSEQNSAKWDAQSFLGRPEPIYTYTNTDRSGQISFKIVVDHPSILNLLTREFFENMSDEESENYINAFFAGCENLDFYELIKRKPTLDPTDINYIMQYLNDSKNVEPEVINKYKTVLGPTQTKETTVIDFKEDIVTESKNESFSVELRFDNNEPAPKESLSSSQTYKSLYTGYIGKKDVYITNLTQDLNTLNSFPLDVKPGVVASDRINIYGEDTIVDNFNIGKQTSTLGMYFDNLVTNYSTYETNITSIKNNLISGKTKNIEVTINSSTSSIDKTDYNLRLSYRRSHSIVKDILERLVKEGKQVPSVKWETSPTSGQKEYILKIKEDLGYDHEGNIKFKVTNSGETDPQCSNKDFKKVFRLNYVAPISVFCRKSDVKVDYDVSVSKTVKTEVPTTVTEQQQGPTSIVLDGTFSVPTKIQKPPIDVMKRIIMKTLSECFYFKKLEENSPLVFDSLKEKLKYFHPAFHSTTPEGLNARLTFLHQCLRPGDTIPIKGLSDVSDINARNTTFGPPPICIIRVGDFYNSKVVIRDLSINYDDSTWDMNPEGIGYQPMIATVQLSVSFIGGQGLEKPVEVLQNALSSNYFANTEIYDERSKETNTRIDGEDSEVFTRKFLEELQDRNKKTPTPENNNSGNDLRNGKYIGELINNKLSYSKLVIDVHDKIKNYFDVYKNSYNLILSKYGPKLGFLILSNTYRTIKTYDIWTSTDSVSTPSESFDLFGLYTKGRDIFIYTQIAKTQFLNDLLLQDLCLIFGFDKFMDTNLMSKTNEEYLNTYIRNEVNNFFDNIPSDKVIKEIENSRNSLIQSFDKVNFIVKHEKDFKINSNDGTNATKGSEVVLSGFTKDLLYDEYEYGVDYIKENSTSFYEDLDGSINFLNPSYTTSDISDILKYVIKDKILDIINLFNTDSVYTNKIITGMANSLGKFTSDLFKEKKFKFKKYKTISENQNLIFDISTVNDNITESDLIFVDGVKINQPIVEVTNKLNFYKTKLQ